MMQVSGESEVELCERLRFNREEPAYLRLAQPDNVTNWTDRMTLNSGRTLDDYLRRTYPYIVSVDAEDGFFVEFPDLPGCVTLVENIDEIRPMADEARRLWIEIAYSQGIEIPEPGTFYTSSDRF